MLKQKYFIISIFFFLILSSIPANANPLKDVFEAATRAYNEKDYPKAQMLYEKALQMHKGFAPAYYYLGLTHKAQNDPSDVILEFFNKAVEINPDYAPVYEDLARMHYALGEFDQAEAFALKAISLDPNLVGAKLMLAWNYLLGKEDPRGAIKYFEEVVDEYELPYAYYGLGLAYLLDNDRAQVLEMITYLRSVDNEPFAKQLENFLKTGYTPPDFDSGSPFIAPRKITEIGKEFNDFTAPENIQGMKIRLKPRSDVKNIGVHQQVNTNPGNERINELRQNGY